MAERVDFSTIKRNMPDMKTGASGMPEKGNVSPNNASNPIFKDNSAQKSSTVSISKL